MWISVLKPEITGRLEDALKNAKNNNRLQTKNILKCKLSGGLFVTFNMSGGS